MKTGLETRFLVSLARAGRQRCRLTPTELTVTNHQLAHPNERELGPREPVGADSRVAETASMAEGRIKTSLRLPRVLSQHVDGKGIGNAEARLGRRKRVVTDDLSSC